MVVLLDNHVNMLQFHLPSTTSTHFLLTLGTSPFQFDVEASDATEHGESITTAPLPSPLPPGGSCGGGTEDDGSMGQPTELLSTFEPSVNVATPLPVAAVDEVVCVVAGGGVVVVGVAEEEELEVLDVVVGGSVTLVVGIGKPGEDAVAELFRLPSTVIGAGRSANRYHNKTYLKIWLKLY